ncbi:MAG: RNA-binding transcriptional accessory protein, partial [Bacteroidaceae bacterium]|nr:RNA-binding transcriptional accessory protein [Bacteroidaceae bacterium]
MNEEKSKSSILAQQLGLEEKYVQATIELLEDGATVPFISRYRKEATGGMNEVQVAAVMDGLDALNELERRREFILSTIEAQGKLTDELRLRIAQCWDTATLEDLYLPYKQKRRTRAQIAREAGLEPMANIIQAQRGATPLTQIARRYLNPEKGIETPEQVIACAQDIIAERVSENERARQSLRYTFAHHAVIESHLVKGKDAEGQNFRSYFDWHEPLARCSSHRLLAMRRGQQEGILRLDIHVDDEAAIERIARLFVKADGEASRLVRESVEDGYRRLLEPSISAEAASEAKRRADEEAIHIFARNLEQLLMAPPLGQKRVLAIDPGFRTGCKVVCLDPQGELLHHEVIFPHPPRGERVQAMMTLQRLVERYHIEAISIGNGTAGRETEDFVRHLDLPGHVEVY